MQEETKFRWYQGASWLQKLHWVDDFCAIKAVDTAEDCSSNTDPVYGNECENPIKKLMNFH